MDASPTAAERVLYRVVLRPRRSASPRTIDRLVLAVAAVLGAAGVAFVAAGAWPVTGFLGLEVLLLWGALRLHHLAGHTVETIDLTASELRVERVDPWGRRRRWSFPAYWMQVAVDPGSRPENRVELRAFGRALAIGSFLTAGERAEVAADLREKLRRLVRADASEPAPAPEPAGC